MRIEDTYQDLFHPGVFAVIANPIADGLAGQPAIRYRLIRSSNQNWAQQANTLRSVSRTPGIVIIEEFDVLESWACLPSTLERIASLHHEAQLRSGQLAHTQSNERKSTS
ncbi:hypothetical protein [Luteimonas sp. MC1750]|uniref:hypothetical protein n=1 Tax=Luteimonas sp. MC1750 TaxID=2799326 RepID=UPI0018F0F675|nr:hypothetical protein [Luteimonas sp. MC1750]MBJ6984028.1 hypothetical protein [Luteimonas sp. MC1750]QQO06840.1 hypothetical protein JGR68_05280 [Luteimonas sp. MC1750]